MDEGPSGFVAWNGERYAGSPPSGWSLRSDGRWWPDSDAKADRVEPDADPPQEETAALDEMGAAAPDQTRSGRYGARARETARRLGDSDRVRAARNAARQIGENERVQAAGAQVAETAQRAARSERIQAVTSKASETAQRISDNEGVQAVRSQAAETARRVQDAQPVEGARAATASAAQGLAQAVPGEALSKGSQRAVEAAFGTGTGRRIPPAWIAVFAGLGGFSLLATLVPWVAVDFANSVDDVVPGSLPVSLVGDRFIRYSPYEMVGVGVLLGLLSTFGTLTGCFAMVRRHRMWLLGSIIAFGGAALLAALVIAVLLSARGAYGWLLPDDWEQYAPEIAIQPLAWGYLLSTLLLSVASVAAFMGMRRRRPTAGVDEVA
ncbi:MAG: hypothetical protein AAF467_25960 [Actinomycetota bacterium]